VGGNVCLQSPGVSLLEVEVFEDLMDQRADLFPRREFMQAHQRPAPRRCRLVDRLVDHRIVIHPFVRRPARGGGAGYERREARSLPAPVDGAIRRAAVQLAHILAIRLLRQAGFRREVGDFDRATRRRGERVQIGE